MATCEQMHLVKPWHRALLLYCFLIQSSMQNALPRIDKMDISKQDLDTDKDIKHTTIDKFARVKTGFNDTFGVGSDNLMTEKMDQHRDKRLRRAESTLVKPFRQKDDDISQCALCQELESLHNGVSERYRLHSVDYSGSHTPSSRFVDGSNCCKIYGTQANCSFCGLASIPKALPANITVLLLGHNNITDNALGPRAFASYPELTVLSLSTNKISMLPMKVFEGLSSLWCLCLQNNTIKMDHNLNSSLAFKALGKSLIYLKLNRNNKNTSDIDLMYPSYALSFLTNLKYLYLDGIPFKRFENPNQKYESLTHLTLAGFNQGYCNLFGLQNHAFELESLKYLDISDCDINGQNVSESAFENLENLQTLNISNNFDLDIATVGNFMYGLRNNKNFEELIMQRINPRFTPCVVIYNETLQYFKNTGLKRIDAMENRIEIIQKGALQMLPDTLQFLNLTGNNIIFGEYIKDLDKLKNLEVLILDGSLFSYNFPYYFPTEDLRNCAIPPYEELVGRNSTVRTANTGSNIINFFPVPPNLKHIYMVNNQMTYTLNNITFSSLNNLKSANLDGNVFQNLIGPIQGLKTLETLNMDDCITNYLSPKFFDGFSSLRKLSMYRNLLGHSLALDNDGSIFKNLKQLKCLNLTLNNIYQLNVYAFKNMNELIDLDLSQNKLGQVNFTIAHMKNLQSLNLTKNQIRTLSRQTMAEINHINKGRQPLQLDLSFNPIACDCDNLEFLEWLTESGVISNYDTNHLYYCDVGVQLDGYKNVIQSLRLACVKHSVIFIVVLCATLFAVLLMLVSLAYRFRWTLRYWYHVARLALHPSQPPHEFEYDVFVSYSNKDGFVEEELIPRLQNEYNLRVQFHGLNFPVGGQITDSIHRAVTSSRKTLVVISKNMLQSHWCNYELMTARREGITRGHQVMVFFFLEAMSSWEMSSEIASYVRENTYVAYPPDPAHRPTFWRKLADDLGADMPSS